MRMSRLAIVIFSLVSGLQSTSAADLLIEYEVDTVSNSVTQSPLAPTYRNSSEATLSASSLDLNGVGFFDLGGAGDYFGSGWRTDGSFNGVNEYYEFTVSPHPSYAWVPSSIKYTLVQYHYSGFLGPAYWDVHASTDGFASVDVPIPVDQDPAHLTTHNQHFLRTVSDFSALGPGPFEELTFRIYGWNASHSVGVGGLANKAGYTGEGSNLLIEGTAFATQSTCGDGIVEGQEECDDGNLIDGDCCSSACLGETGSTLVQSFLIDGAPTGTPWSWELYLVPGYQTISDLSVPGVFGSTLDVADAFAASITTAASNAGWNECEIAVTTRENDGGVHLDLIVGHGAAAVLGVGANDGPPDECIVFDELCTRAEGCSCTFNPSIVLAAPEPSTGTLLASGIVIVVLLASVRRRPA